jgi:CRP/FNR family cyclic AMP-dependent transcriptional regulator
MTTTPRWPRATILGRLCDDARERLLRLGSRVTVAPQTQIMRLGAADSDAFLLLDGYVKVTGNEDGREPLLDIRVGGDLVGEMAGLSGAPRSAMVTAGCEVVAQRMPADRLRGFLVAEPSAAIEVARAISERLRWANERRVEFAALSASVRVTRVLLALVRDYGRPVDDGFDLGVPLTQEEIASLAGVRLPTVEKTLRGLQRSAVVRAGYRSITVLDKRSLAEAAEPGGEP